MLDSDGLAGCGESPDRRLFGRDAAAAGDRPGARRTSPRSCFLDEPVSSLDPEGRRDLLELIAGPARRGDGRLLDPRPVRRGADLRPGRDPRPRTARDRGAARGPAGRPRPPDLPARTRRPGRTDRSARLVERLRGAPWVDRRHRRRAVSFVSRSRIRTPRRARSCSSSSTRASSSTCSNALGRRSRTSSSSSCGPPRRTTSTAADSSGLERSPTDERAGDAPPQGAPRAVADVRGCPSSRPCSCSSACRRRCSRSFTPEILEAVGGDQFQIVHPAADRGRRLRPAGEEPRPVRGAHRGPPGDGLGRTEKERGTAALILSASPRPRRVPRSRRWSRSPRRSGSRHVIAACRRVVLHRWSCSSRSRSPGSWVAGDPRLAGSRRLGARSRSSAAR